MDKRLCTLYNNNKSVLFYSILNLNLFFALYESDKRTETNQEQNKKIGAAVDKEFKFRIKIWKKTEAEFTV